MFIKIENHRTTISKNIKAGPKRWDGSELAAPAQDPSSVPRTHIGKLTRACNSRFRESEALS